MAAKRILNPEKRLAGGGVPKRQMEWTVRGALCSRKYSIVYAPVNKSGCTTVKNIMYFLDKGEWYPDPMGIHGDFDALLRSAGSDRDAYYRAIQNRKVVFSFVREPFARAYSSFNQKIFQQGKHTFPKIRKMLVDEYGTDFPTEEREYSAVDHGKNFLCFLRFVKDNRLEGTPMEKVTSHWIPQKAVLDKYRSRVNIDFVGRIENFAQGMQFVLDLAKVDVPVDFNVRFNESARPPFKLEEIMTDEIHDMLSEIYGGDLKYFGYEDAYKPAK